jgi:hypothetical protein
VSQRRVAFSDADPDGDRHSDAHTDAHSDAHSDTHSEPDRRDRSHARDDLSQHGLEQQPVGDHHHR